MPSGGEALARLLTGSNQVEPLVIPLDAESVHSLLRDFSRILSRVEGVEEVGDGYVVLRVPRRLGLFKLGARVMRLDMRLYRLENALVLLLGRGIDSLVVVVSVVNVGEGVHVIVSGGGGGKLSPATGMLVKGIRDAIAEVVEGARPEAGVTASDNELAAEGAHDAPLVFYDSFTPVRDVLTEAAYRVVAALGPGEYIVEIHGMLREYHYLARLVIRGRRITGVYAEMDGRRAKGEEALRVAQRPPSHRVRVLAWALEGAPHRARVNAPQPVYEDGGHAVYRLWPGGRPEYGGLTLNTYVVGSGYEYAVIDPTGPSEWSQMIRGLVGDMEQIRLVVVGDASAVTQPLLSRLASESPAEVLAPPYSWAQLAAILEQPDRVATVPLSGSRARLGRSELRIIPAGSCGGMLTVYDPVSKTLFTGPVLGFLTPPGVWYADRRLLRDALRAYLSSTLGHTAIARWVEEVRSLDVERIAPRYGPVVEGRDQVRTVLEEAAQLAKEVG